MECCRTRWARGSRTDVDIGPGEIVALPAPRPPIVYSGAVAMKKVAWAVGKFGVAEASTGTVIAAFEKMCAHLQPIGITVIVDHAILSKVLPGFVFMALVALHYVAKTKTGVKWL